MDEKYSGCNIVESTVTEKTVQHVKTPKPSRLKSFFIRLAVSAALVAAIVAVHYLPQTPAFSGIKSVAGGAFKYDVFGNSSFGVTDVFDFLS